MIKHIATVAVYTDDQPEALRFWTEQVGFAIHHLEPLGPDANWLEVAPPSAQSRLVIYPKFMLKDWEAKKASIVFECTDLSQTYRELSSRGVVFTQEPQAMPWGSFAVFQDPDGNEFMLRDPRK